MKKIWALCLLTALLLLVLPQAVRADNSVFRGYSKGYQYILLGNYPYDSNGEVWGNDPFSSGNLIEQPVLWRILSVEDNTLLLLTEYVIEMQQVTFISDTKAIKHYQFEKHEKYSDTDLCHWINTDMLNHLFNGDPMVNALMEEGENGRLFCLTTKQFEESGYGFRDTVKPLGARVTGPTPYAKNRRIYRDKKINLKEGGSPYWVGSMMKDKYKLYIIGYDGHISGGVYSRDNIGIRPGVRLNLDLIAIESGSGTRNDPFILRYTGEIPTATPEPDPEATPAPGQDAEPDPTPAPELIPAPESGPDDSGEPEDPYDEDEDFDEPDDSDDEDEDFDEPDDPEEPEEQPAGEGEIPDNPAEEETEEPEQTASRENTALISFLGDCSIGDAYSAKGNAKSYHSVVDREGYAWPFSLIQKYIGRDDLTVANLEIVITTRTKHRNLVYPLRADPDHVNILKEGSIEAVNTANNHCYDYYRDGYADTLKYLDEAGIDRFGSVRYTQKSGFDDVLVKDVNGIRFGFFGLSYPSDTDLKHVEKLTKQLREEQHCDFIIASLHWGRETYTVPAQGYARYAQKVLDRGADMIYGHHPHVLQPIAFYKNKPILFSTGNATFAALSSNMDKHAGIFQLTFEKTENGTVTRKIEVIPCKYYRTGDYRIEEETDETEREKTYKILSPGKKLASCVNPPASFLKTGVILFNEAGEPIMDE